MRALATITDHALFPNHPLPLTHACLPPGSQGSMCTETPGSMDCTAVHSPLFARSSPSVHCMFLKSECVVCIMHTDLDPSPVAGWSAGPSRAAGCGGVCCARSAQEARRCRDCSRMAGVPSMVRRGAREGACTVPRHPTHLQAPPTHLHAPPAYATIHPLPIHFAALVLPELPVRNEVLCTPVLYSQHTSSSDLGGGAR